MTLEEHTIAIPGLDVAYLAAGPIDGPLALCLHGFPDTAHTYRHLLPELAAAGFRAVAPFSRGYAPSGIPADGCYQSGALASDANALHEALGGTGEAVIVGHDWGAYGAYGAVSSAPERWRRLVTMALPVGQALASQFMSYPQIRRSFYMYFFQSPMANSIVGADDLAFIANLWEDWSPGYDATTDLEHVRGSIGAPENLAAALGYYRVLFDPTRQSTDFAEQQAAVAAIPQQPTLYLHGANDGCIGMAVAEVARGLLSEGSEVSVLDDAGHFIHLEHPDRVNKHIVSFLTA